MRDKCPRCGIEGELSDDLSVIVNIDDSSGECNMHVIGSDYCRIRELEAQLASQQTIIDTLPKCWRLDDSGKLVKDKPLIPGEIYWVIAQDTYTDEEPAVIIKTAWWDGGQEVGNASEFLAVGDCDWEEFTVESVYGSREAAEAAMKEKE